MRAINIVLAVSLLFAVSWAGLRSPAYGDTYEKVWDSGSAISNSVYDVAVGDTDSDGKPEIIVSDYVSSGGAKIYVFENTGDNSYQLVWNSGTTLTMRYCYIAIGDQDGDGKFEIVAGEWNDPAYNAKLHVFENNGDNTYQEVWNNGSAFNGMNITALFLGDADNDGKREIILGTGPLGNSKIRVYENTTGDNYEEVWTSENLLSDTVLGGAVGDTDGDSNREIIVGSGDLDSQVHVFECTGVDNSYSGPVWDSGGTFSNQMWANTGDQDGDGKAEIIAGGEDRVVHVFEHPGGDWENITSVWNSGTVNGIIYWVATGDGDHDGNREIIVSCGDGKVYVFENTGDNAYQGVWNSGSLMSGDIYRVGAGDQDRDGKFEIIAAAGPDNKVYVFENSVSAYVSISADADGNGKNGFSPEEHIYGKTTGLSLTDDTYPLYVVATKTWTSEENQTIPARIDPDGTSNDPDTTVEVHSGNIQKDAGGTPEDIWVSPPASETAQYDIVVDINKDGDYDPAVDLLDADSGIQCGFSLPVELSSFTATASAKDVTLRWRTESEVNNLGFNLYRAEETEGVIGEYLQINGDLIQGAGNSPTRHTYQFVDRGILHDAIYWYRLEDVDFDGTKTLHDPISVTVRSQNMVEMVPTAYALHQNAPNPFNPRTTIAYDLPEASNVTLSLYTLTGQKIAMLVSDHQEARHHEVAWDGSGFGNSVYFYRLEAGEFVETRRMVLIK